MKSRQNVIAEAASLFAIRLRGASPRAKTLVDSVLPNAAADVASLTPFEQKTPVPRGMLKSFTASVIERVLTKGVRLPFIAPALLPSEVEYITLVLDEVYAWAKEQGYEQAPRGEKAAS